jgi:tape measure domain-containing protein
MARNKTLPIMAGFYLIKEVRNLARDISIAISAKDNFSSAITTMRSACQAFNKDITALQSKLDAFNRTKITLKVDSDKARSELKEAEKQFIKTGKSAEKMKLELTNAKYDNVRRNLSLVSDNAKQAEKDIRSLTDAISKKDNKAATVKKGSAGSLNSNGTSDAISMVSNIAQGLANSYIKSAYGEEAGIVASSVMSNGAMGAAIGTAIAPGIGTVLGALGGGILGYFQGESAVFDNKDEAFKSYYKELYEEVLNNQNQSLANGSEIASNRETNRIAFTTLLGGDTKADGYLNSLTDFAKTTSFSYDELTNLSKVLLTYGYKQEELLPLLAKVGDAGSALGMSSEDMTLIAASLGQMQTTDAISFEDLNPFLERGIDVWSYLTEASGKTKKEVQEMVSNGLVPGSEAAKAIADYMGADFAGNMEKQAQTYAGLTSTLEDAKTNLDKSMGEGYNDTRKKGIEDQISFLEGNSGSDMKEAYNQIGQWKAYQENQAEQFQRDVMNSVMSGKLETNLETNLESSEQRDAIERLMQEYEEARKKADNRYRSYSKEEEAKAGAEMGRILAEAQAIASNEYNASDGAQLALDANRTLAENLLNDSGSLDAYYNAGYVMGQQFSKGLEAAINNEEEEEDVSTFSPWYDEDKVGVHFDQKTETQDNGSVNKYATGLGYVPYNNYPAYLHEGERVLTASENRNYRSSVPITISGNTFVIQKESDIKGVAQQVANLINQALVLTP